MENVRYILYLVIIASVFLILSAIKMILPEPEYKPPVDHIGMKLYRPIFFGTADKAQVASTKPEDKFEEEVKEEEFVDESDSKPKPIAQTKKEIVKKEKVEKPKATEEPKVKEPTSKSSNTDYESYFEQLLIDYKNTVLSERKYRNDVVVRYYRHVPDGDNAKVLVDYGFYIHERPVRNKTLYKTLPSNIIYYGKDFPKSDLKIIAYLLIKNGMQIKEIRPFKNFSGWKHKSIEIGGNPRIIEKQTLSLKALKDYKFQASQ